MAGAFTVISQRARWPSPSLIRSERTGRSDVVTSSVGIDSIATASAGDEPTTGCSALDREAATNPRRPMASTRAAHPRGSRRRVML